MYIGVYFVTVFILAFIQKKDGGFRELRINIVYPALLMLFVIYFLLPFIKSLTDLGLDDKTRARTFWALTPSLIIALGFTLFISTLDGTYKRLAAIAAAAVILAFCGEFKINNNVFQKSENLYKLPGPLLAVADEVLKEGGARLIVPYETAHVFRQYSTDIKLLYGEDATILRVIPARREFIKACDQMQTEAPDLGFIKDIAKENEVDYILFDSVYHRFGGHDLNFDGYTEQADFAGDRSASEEYKQITRDVKLIDDGENIYWDLSGFDMEYVGTYGQYLLYRF